ncbi:Abi family protein [Vagococcus hydrophili]|uniref:Abi family protein n=1 Tax=Vagococcus hydrophili TaxID=2714947 RepID=A0A6G8AT06_9ENTE|nr:Abi family protein [Vagococcus hydrophili]QIL48063.1 Abi family protein [Vagococcus hydrophili]
MRTSKSYSKSVYYSGTEKLKMKQRVEFEILPKVKLKKALTVDEQISYMEYKGIKFNMTSKQEAKKILENLNYYFKVSVYRKFFNKNNASGYDLLDFKMLTDLASIDMGVRYFLLQLTLDVEHAAKVALINDLTKNSRVDEYLIVTQFKNTDKNYFKMISKRFSGTKYMKDFHDKRRDQISFWVLIELLDMGGLVKFLKFYVNNPIYNTKPIAINVKNASSLLVYTKNIRNCTAHSNPFIYNIFERRVPASNQLVSYANVMGIDSNTVRYDKVNDLVSLFHLHKYLCSEELSGRRKREGLELVKRSKRLGVYYKGNVKLEKTVEIFNILLDCLN